MPSEFENVTISLPRSFVRALESIRRADVRGRSEIFREAVREYLQRRGWRIVGGEILSAKGEVVLERARLRALDRAHEEIRRGEFIGLEDLLSKSENVARRRGTKR